MADRTVVVELIAKTAPFSSGMTRAGLSLGDFSKGTLAAGAGMALLAAGVGASVGAYASFDAAMTKSTAIMGDVSETMRGEMSDAAREVATTTKFSADQAAESYFFLASAGLDAAQSIEALPAVASFAQAGMFDMALATDLLTDAQSALGLTSDDTAENMRGMARVSDVLVKANTLANASVQQFSESLTNKAGAALRVLNKDVEEGAAVLAVYADQGLKGAAAGEALSIVLRDLQRAALEESEEFERMGIAVFDAEGNMRNIADIIEDVEGATDGMSDATRKATLSNLGFQERSVQQIIALLGTSDAIRGYEEDLRSAAGITDEVADKQMLTLTEQMGLLGDQVKDVAIGLGEDLEPELMELVPTLSSAIESLGLLAESAFPVLVGALGAAGEALEGLALIGSAFLGVFSDAASTNAHMIVSLRNLRKAAQLGNDPVVTLANQMVNMARHGKLAADSIGTLAAATYGTAKQIALATGQTLEWANSHGYAADQTSFLTQSLIEQTTALVKNEEATLAEIEAAFGAGIAYEVQDGIRREAFQSMYQTADASATAAEAMGDEENVVMDLAGETQTLSEALDAATVSQDGLAGAMRAFADPAFAAVRAMGQLSTAEQKVTELEKDGKKGTKEWAEAVLDLADKTLIAQSGLDEFDAAGITDQVSVIKDALGFTRTETEELLTVLGVLDGTEVAVVFEFIGRVTGRPFAGPSDLSMPQVPLPGEVGFVGPLDPASDKPIGTSGFTPDTPRPTFTGPMGLAEGGFARAQVPVIVGEDGPELFIPRSSGVVVPNSELANMTGGRGGDTNITLNNPVSQNVQRDLQVGLLMAQVAGQVEGGF